MRRPAKVAVDVLLVLQAIGLVALLWTGGYEISLGWTTLKSNTVLPIVRNTVILLLTRVLVVSGLRTFLPVIATFSVALVLTEISLRAFKPPLADPTLNEIHRTSNLYGWEITPGVQAVGALGESFSINSSGHRDEEWIDPKVIRIAILGDSFTFGMAVASEATYAKQLQTRLQRKFPGVRTMNFGVIGYNMWQYLVLLDRKVPVYQPDHLIIGLFLDDVLLSVPPFTVDKNYKGYMPFPDNDGSGDAPSRLRLLNLMENLNGFMKPKYRYHRGQSYFEGLEKRKESITAENDAHRYYKAQTGTLGKALYREFRDALAQVRNWSVLHDIPVLLLYIPDASQIHEAGRQHITGLSQKRRWRQNFRCLMSLRFSSNSKIPGPFTCFPWTPIPVPRGTA